MNYVSLYRKYRSMNFDEIIGQQNILTTLKNAIIHNRLAHAYLFTGPRGTGKTSTARIFAKALNCGDKATPNPCGKCDQCKKIANGEALNVIEIDAASNRGIDEIRDLRDKIKYKPVEGRYKIYIIDEVHMLTNEAFNALLKTLEEPPSNTIFILATTEPQRVPVTISSRCQKFDFGRISLNEITAHLKLIAEKEKFKIDEDAVILVAKHSEGSMRDAISLLDQLVSFCSGKITLSDVASVLGTAEPDFLFEMAAAAAKGDDKGLMSMIERAISLGVSIPQLTKDLSQHFRNLFIAKIGATELLEMPKEQILKISEDCKTFEMESLKKAIKALSEAESDMKWHPNSRLVLEVCLIDLLKGDDKKEVAVTINSKLQIPNPKQIPNSNVQLSRTETIVVHDNKSASVNTTVDNELLTKIKVNWKEIMNKVKGKSLFGFVSLQEAEPSNIDEKGILILSFKKGYSFHKTRVEEESNKKAVESSIKELLDVDIPVKCILSGKDEIKAAVNEAQSVSVDDIIDMFDGKIV